MSTPSFTHPQHVCPSHCTDLRRLHALPAKRHALSHKLASKRKQALDLYQGAMQALLQRVVEQGGDEARAVLCCPRVVVARTKPLSWKSRQLLISCALDKERA